MVQNEASVFDFTSHFDISLRRMRKSVCSSVKVSCNPRDTVKAYLSIPLELLCRQYSKLLCPVIG